MICEDEIQITVHQCICFFNIPADHFAKKAAT